MGAGWKNLARTFHSFLVDWQMSPFISFSSCSDWCKSEITPLKLPTYKIGVGGDLVLFCSVSDIQSMIWRCLTIAGPEPQNSEPEGNFTRAMVHSDLGSKSPLPCSLCSDIHLGVKPGQNNGTLYPFDRCRRIMNQAPQRQGSRESGPRGFDSAHYPELGPKLAEPGSVWIWRFGRSTNFHPEENIGSSLIRYCT